MDRRAFLKVSAAAAAAGSLPWREASASSAWRTFEAITRVEILQPRGISRVWLPLPAIDNNVWQKVVDNSWSGNAAKGQVLSDGKYGVRILYAEWRAGENPPSWDKQILRDWLETTGWDKEPPPPALDPRIVEQLARRYLEVCERITGRLPEGVAPSTLPSAR